MAIRFYDGLPSVTSILDIRRKPSLEAWQQRVGLTAAEQKRKEAAKFGTRVHALIQTLIEDGELELDPKDRAHPYVQGFKNWREKYQPTDLRCEVVVVSKQYGYAGTADLLCQLNGEPYVIDFKTSKQFDPSMGLQLSAYGNAVREMSGASSRLGILQLTPEVARQYRFKEYPAALPIFLAHKTIFDWMLLHKLLVLPNGYTGGLIDSLKHKDIIADNELFEVAYAELGDLQ